MIEAITGSDTRTQVTFNPMTISPADRRSITLVGVNSVTCRGRGEGGGFTCRGRGAALPAVGGGRLYLPWEGGGFTCRGRGAALPAGSWKFCTLPTHLTTTAPLNYKSPIIDGKAGTERMKGGTFVVIAKDRTIFRFSTTHGCFILSPFNPLRRLALFTLTHSYPFMGSTPANITALMLPCDETCRWTTWIRTVRDLTANQIMEILSPRAFLVLRNTR
ncbi:hypothetical protein Bbelb_119750 [Branchiostoma belcheri]|nr:hypothetical protein Bbelb_119750 [Branchiostoma belcheri]